MPWEFAKATKRGRPVYLRVNTDTGEKWEIPTPAYLPKELTGPPLKPGVFESIENPVGRSIANLIPSFLEEMNPLRGLFSDSTEAPPIPARLGLSPKTEIPQPEFSWQEHIKNYLPKHGRVLKAIGQSLIEPYSSSERFYNTLVEHPGKIPADILSFYSPKMSGPGLGSAVKAVGKAVANPKQALKKGILKYYIKGGLTGTEADFNPTRLEEVVNLGTRPVTSEQVIKEMQDADFPINLSTLTGQPGHTRIEMASKEFPKFIEQEQKAIRKRLSGFLNEVTPPTLTSSKFTLSPHNKLSTPENLTASWLREEAIKSYKETANAMTQAQDELFFIFSNELPDSPSLRNSKAIIETMTKDNYVDKFPEIYARLPKQWKSIIGPKYSEWQTLRNELKARESFTESTNLLGSANLANPGASDPVLRGLINRNYNDFIKQAFQNKETFARSIEATGLTPDHAKYMVMRELISSGSKTGKDFNASDMLDFLTEKADIINYAFSGGGPDAKIKAGLQQFARALNRSYQGKNISMINFETAKAAGKGAELQAMAGAAPAAMGAPVLKGRLGVAAGLTGMKLQSKAVAWALTNPDVSWLLTRMAQTSPNSPAAKSLIRRLAKITGEMNIPVTVIENGKEREIN